MMLKKVKFSELRPGDEFIFSNFSNEIYIRLEDINFDSVFFIYGGVINAVELNSGCSMSFGEDDIVYKLWCFDDPEEYLEFLEKENTHVT